jgi:hypothetical protein
VLGLDANGKPLGKGMIEGGFGGSTGLNSLLAGVPTTRAHDLQTKLDTIRGNIGFDKLQDMRANSPTGGALGSVSEQENKTLQAVMGSLDQGQTAPQFRDTLVKLYGDLIKARDARKAAFDRQYASTGRPSGGGSAVAPPASAQRQTGQIYNTPRGPMKWTGTGWLPQ